jgi:hypothetical protein
MEYVKLPPPRGRLVHEKLITMVIATAFGAGAIAAARSCNRPPPAVRAAHEIHAPFVSLSSSALDRHDGQRR